MSKKNIEMLKTFGEVMRNNEKIVDLIIPNSYTKSVYDIDYEELYQKGYRNLLFDIDNTLLPVNDIKVPKELINLMKKVQDLNFNICIMSNNHLDRVVPPAKALGVEYLADANKPTKESFDRALRLIDGNIDDSVMIGDQMLSDIKGANSYGLYTILVDPLSNKYDIKTGTSRVLQNIMEKKLHKRNIFHKNSYYK